MELKTTGYEILDRSAMPPARTAESGLGKMILRPADGDDVKARMRKRLARWAG